MKKWLLIFMPFSLLGCTAGMVLKPGPSGSAYAPVNEKQLTNGEVKYLDQGADFIIKQRREDAYRQMYQSCDGKYRIAKESEMVDGQYANANTAPIGNTLNTSMYAGAVHYRVIDFECVH